MNKAYIKQILRSAYHLSLFKIVNKLKGRVDKAPIDTSKHIVISIPELFFHHNTEKDFARYDMIVRLLAVENYYGKNNFGFDFYRRMQTARMGKDWTEPAVVRFNTLIRSYDEKGYDTNSEIELDSNLHLLDGSHRMAMAMYHGCKTINAVVRPYSQTVFYGIEWFRINGFSDSESILLKEKYQEIHNKYQQPFICTLWHPAYPFFDEITEHLKLFGCIVEVKEFNLSAEEYKYYTRGIYAIDDIAKWKIEKKIEYMMSPELADTYHLRMIALLLEDPNFRLKDSTFGTLSKKCELIKQLIRNSYKTKIVNYFHDIIIHIGDNYLQNRYIYKFLTVPAIDVKKFLDDIIQFNYVITKTEVDYMPTDFPFHYPFGKDIDIIAADIENYEKIRDYIIKNAKEYNTMYDVRVLTEEKDGQEYRTRIRFELTSLLVIQFDISISIAFTKKGFSKVLCADRERKTCYYIPTKNKEMLVRLCECFEHPEKKHHFEYIKNNIACVDAELCDKFLNFDWNKIIKGIL